MCDVRIILPTRPFFSCSKRQVHQLLHHKVCTEIFYHSVLFYAYLNGCILHFDDFFCRTKGSMPSVTDHLRKLLMQFHKSFKPKPIFGPLCPLSVTNSCNHPAIHVLNIMKPRLGQSFSCSGESYVLPLRHISTKPLVQSSFLSYIIYFFTILNLRKSLKSRLKNVFIHLCGG